jgi:hypothetical protein
MSQFSLENDQGKVRISLSNDAYDIVIGDCEKFSTKNGALKKGTLVNAIVKNLSHDAECSISRRLKDYKSYLEETFKSEKKLRSLQSNSKSTIIEALVAACEYELRGKYTNRKSSDKSLVINLQNDVVDMLTNDPESDEEKYYGDRPGRYINQLLEEYARMSFYEREEIVYKDIIEKIELAIDNCSRLKIKTTKGAIYHVKPYRIMTTPVSTYHYLVAYDANSIPSYKYQSDKTLSFRISNIKKAEVEKAKDSYLTFSEEDELKKALEERGVPYVGSPAHKSWIRVWLSDAGIKNYNSRLHNRPQGTPSDEDPHIYTFDCTTTQILYYFLNFGKDVKIIAPKSLAQKFKQAYSEALENYN